MIRLKKHCALLVLGIAVLLATDAASAIERRGLLFVGDANYPPYTYLEGAQPKGVVIDIIRALAQNMDRPIEIRLMEWTAAQALVSEGKADALMQLSITEARKQVYAFSEPLNELHFSVFVRSGKVGIAGISDLRGMTVGVTRGGLPRQLLDAEPQIQVELLDDYAQGFRMLQQRKLDAVVGDLWVGSYLLAEQGIADVQVIGDPVARRLSAIAVPKEHGELLAMINEGLRALTTEGTLARINRSWKPQEVLFQTREQAAQATLLLTIGVLLLMLASGTVWVVLMRRGISSRRAVEALLVESEARQQALMHAIPDLVWLKDPEGVFLSCNQRFEALYGAPEKEIQGKSDYDFVPREVADLFRANDLAAIAKDEPSVNEEWVTFASDGHRELLETTKVPFFDATGRLVGVLGIGHDITERKQTERKLRDSEALVRNKLTAILAPEGDIERLELQQIIDIPAIQAMMDDFYQVTGILSSILDLSGKVLIAVGWQNICTQFHRVNPMMCRNCHESDTLLSQGVEPGTIKYYKCKNNLWDVVTPLVIGGRHVGNLFSGQFFFEDDEIDLELFRAQARRHGLNEEEYMAAMDLVPRFSRATMDAAMSFFKKLAKTISALSYSQIELARMAAEIKQINVDLEDRVQRRTAELEVANQSLISAKIQAEASNRAKSLFLANMSHELRTPLNAVLGFSQLLQRDSEIGIESRKKLATISRSGQHLLALINDVLEISRIEAGRSSTAVEPFDLLELLQSTEEMIRERADDKGLNFHVEQGADLPAFVEGDAPHLRQVLINLLGNAVKYTEQGSVSLRVSRCSSQQGSQICFVVTDTGPGIAAAEQERIFQAFYQTEVGIAKGDGTGLGLAISREYTRMMDGWLDVASRLGEGSVFSLTLRLPEALKPLLKSAADQVVGLESGQEALRVLVVDDQADNRELVQQLLEATGFQVRTADNGQQAVELFVDWQPCFIWMDMRMPVLDGYAATRKIRALPGGGAVKIVALTASAFAEERREVLAAGCDEMLSKPLEEARLFAVMGDLLGLHYRYAEIAAPAAQPGTEVDISMLPAQELQQLKAAAEALDLEVVRQMTVTLAEAYPELASALDRLLQGYRFDRIVELCATAESERTIKTTEH